MGDPAECEVFRSLGVLFSPGQVVEVRAITDDGMASGYFDDMAVLSESIPALDSAGTQGIYVTLNEVTPALLSRRANRIKMRLSKKDATTADGDILRRRWLPIDIDPVRPSGVSSSDAEHGAALIKAERVATFLAEQGFPPAVLGDSGNGAHLLYRIDLPNDDPGRNLVKRCMEVLSALFSDGTSTIDTANYNAARIWKLYGTVSRKGDHTAERPHRRSRLVRVPDDLVVVNSELLEHLASLLPERAPPPPRKNQGIDLAAWLYEHSMGVRAEKPYQGGTLFVLEECPFSGSHRDGAFAIQFGNGAIFAGCHHASCGGGVQRWKDLRDQFENRKKCPTPSLPSAQPTSTEVPADNAVRDETMAILGEGDPLAYLLRTFALDHVGDETVAACLIMSLASQSVINTNGLHVSVTGESGKGKSHTFRTMLRQVPERFRLKGAMSNKALYYLDDMQPGSVIVLDDTTLSEEVQEILKSATTSFQEPIEYRTVTKERKVRVCTIPERCVWWVAKVEGSGDDQVLNRMLTCWIDDSPEQDARVLSRVLEKDETVPVATVQERQEVRVCQAIWESLRAQRLYVVIPFARRIRFSNAANRRNPEMLLDLIKAHALLRFMQREKTEAEDGSPCILSTRKDFEDAVRLYDYLNGTAGGQETKLTKVEAEVLGVIVKAGWPEFTVQQIQQVTGRSSSHVRKTMNGYVSRGYTYSGLLEKCPAISYTDRTVMTSEEEGLSIKRRTIAYQFNPEIYRQWAKGGSCWLDPGDDAEGNGNSDGVKERKEMEEGEKNSAPQNESDPSEEERKDHSPADVLREGKNNSDTVQGDEAGEDEELSFCMERDSTRQINPSMNVVATANSCSCCEVNKVGNPGNHSAPGTRNHLKASDFKKLDIIRRGTCAGCNGKKYLAYIEKLTERRKSLPARAEPWYLCKDCYEDAVRRERASAPPLPGLIDIDRLERISTDLGRCTICGLEKAEWIDRERGVKVCEGCWEREMC
ncbi:hypothetical protein J2741_001699 [Methanolinea mesophila]|uniref:hypothetical protein n=1 Tax=Methanolinea mesophila TaxID=547055 RepID=UPI001AE4FC9F|nr:hypothetical protein [Methanolinea mesophila]MBP1929152.1 hypothetical protein [Methanolinea mesophila]